MRDALERLKNQSKHLQGVEEGMNNCGGKQYCVTEPDARLMRSGREGMVLGYNLQSAVDTDTGVIVHHELTDEGTDNRQLLFERLF